MMTADEWHIILLSLKVSLVAVGLTLPVAFGLAWLLARKHFPGAVIIDALVHLPLVLPPVVTGWLLLLLFGANGAIGYWLQEAFGLTFMFRWTGAALASAVMALPLMVRAMRVSIEAVDPRLENAARTLGASKRRVFWTVSLPLAVPGILAGVVLGFARSIGEFGATITFVSNIPGQTRTLPIAIYASLQIPGLEGEVARLAVIALVISLIALFASELIARRGHRRTIRDVL